jgi:uncharacterized protein YciI
MHFLLFYDYVSDYETLREHYRTEHLELAWRAHQRGELELGGAYADTQDGAVLWFSGDDAAVAERFAAMDPYVKNGLVSRWWVRPWATVVGARAANPVYPR